jgi:hypothetical protein
MDEVLASLVRQRAGERCEYCLLPSSLSLMPFEIDHVIPLKHGGLTIEGNLALACFYCNRYKGPNIAGFDPDTRTMSRLFNPRNDVWRDNFHWKGASIGGTTPVGRTTIEVLRLNHPEMILVRKVLQEERVFPF